MAAHGTACAECLDVFHGSAPKLSTGIVVVDTSPAAAFTLGGYRPAEEATYVLCRMPNERRSEFANRVLRRVHRIVGQRSLASLWYVAGARGFDAAGAQRLLQALVPFLDEGGSLTVAGPRSQSATVLGWVDALLRQRADGIDVHARFYPDAAELERRPSAVRGVELLPPGPRPALEAWAGQRALGNRHARVRPADLALRSARARRVDEAWAPSR
jgi:hypothetical protein